MGFVLEPAIAESLIKLNPSNADVIRPYLSGADLNDDPQQRPGRFVINFFGWSIDRAKNCRNALRSSNDSLNQVARRLTAERTEKWWIYRGQASSAIQSYC